jgi:F0F1-type ATP synthase membrane subunit c/vacuolar-type H+-ATPase subunit K
MEEISAENLAGLEKRYKTTVFLVSALIFSAVIFVLAAWFVTRNRESVSDDSFLTLWLLVLFLSAATFVLRRQLFGWERLKNIALLKGVSGLARTLQTNTIVLCALAEIVIMIGFAIAFLSGNFFDMLRAAVITLIIWALNFPRLALWKKIVANLEKA